MGSGMSAVEQNKAELHFKIFKELDTNEDGTLSIDELKMFLFAFSNCSDDDATKVIGKMISQVDGTVDKTDGDGDGSADTEDGSLDPQELAAWFKKRDYGVSALEVMLHSIRLYRAKQELPTEKSAADGAGAAAPAADGAGAAAPAADGAGAAA